MDRAKMAYEAWLISLGHKPAWHENDVRHQAAWQAVADALDAANEDSARLDYILLESEDTGWHEAALAKAGPHDGTAGQRQRWLAAARAEIDAARKGE